MGNIRRKITGRFAGMTAAFLATLGLLLMPLSPLVTPVAADVLSPKPWDITTGPDGALWFTEQDGNKIGRITTAGVVTEYAVPTANAKPTGIAAGPDGALWFTENNVSKIGRIATDGAITEYDLPRNANNDEVMPTDIVAGSNNDLWYTAKGSLGRITTAGVATRTELPSQYSDVVAKGIINNFGAIWFTIPAVNTASGVGRIGSNGALTIFPLFRGIVPTDISSGPTDGVWITTTSRESSGQIVSSLVWRVAEDGSHYRPYNIPTESNPSTITVAPGGNLWYNGYDNDTVVHFIRDGADVSYQLSPDSCPQGLTYGPDSAMWFTEACSGKIGRIGSNGALTEYSLTTPAPLVSITNPTENSTVSGTVNIDATIYSASAYSRMLYVRNSSNQAVVSQYQFSVPNSTTTYNYSWDTTTVPNGTYTIILSAKDSQGNKDNNSTSTVHVTVQN